MSVLLVATHLAAFLAGGITVRFLTLHFVRAVDVDGHPALEFTTGDDDMPSPRHPSTYGLVMAVAALILIGIGTQALLAAQDNAQRDARDRRYTQCLSEFASDLVTTIERRTRATERLDRAKAARDAATDRVIRVVVLARRVPPEATEAEFDRALEAQLAAQQHLQQVRRQTAAVRRVNQYETPAATCQRP